MVHHHRLDSQVGGGAHLRHAGDAAVERDEQPRALPGQPPHRLGVEAVAFHQAVGHVGHDLRTRRPQEAGQERGRGDAVHVVVAVEGDALAARDGAHEPLHGRGHAFHEERVRQVGEARLQEALGVRRIGKPAAGEHPRRQRLQPQLTREPPRRRLVTAHLDPAPRYHGWSSSMEP